MFLIGSGANLTTLMQLILKLMVRVARASAAEEVISSYIIFMSPLISDSCLPDVWTKMNNGKSIAILQQNIQMTGEISMHTSPLKYAKQDWRQIRQI